MKKELDFASSEIERLRAKLIVEDFDMPPLSSELFGSGKSHSFKLNESMDNQIELANSEFSGLKKAISSTQDNT
mgnify:CR=1 FL=1